MLDPDAMAFTHLHGSQQDRSAWTNEVELRRRVDRLRDSVWRARKDSNLQPPDS